METAGQVSENDGTDQKLPDQQLKKGVTDYEQDCIYFPGTGRTGTAAWDRIFMSRQRQEKDL